MSVRAETKRESRISVNVVIVNSDFDGLQFGDRILPDLSLELEGKFRKAGKILGGSVLNCLRHTCYVVLTL
jgi:hypothetical protein